MMTAQNPSEPSTTSDGPVPRRVLSLVAIIPACSLGLVAILVICLVPFMPDRIAVHSGPDGVGYGVTWLLLSVTIGIAAVVLAIGAAAALGFVRAGHWYQTEKMIAVSIFALGYGVLGVALGAMLSTVGSEPNAVSGDSMGISMIGFVLMFIATAWIYTARLPKGQMESLLGN